MLVTASNEHLVIRRRKETLCERQFIYRVLDIRVATFSTNDTI